MSVNSTFDTNSLISDIVTKVPFPKNTPAEERTTQVITRGPSFEDLLNLVSSLDDVDKLQTLMRESAKAFLKQRYTAHSETMLSVLHAVDQGQGAVIGIIKYNGGIEITTGNKLDPNRGIYSDSSDLNKVVINDTMDSLFAFVLASTTQSVDEV